MPRSANAMNPNRKAEDIRKGGVGKVRSTATIKRLQMYGGKAYKRNADGRIVDGDLVSSKKSGNRLLKPGEMARVEPNRKWFGNTRLVGAKELDEFRSEMASRVADPYSVVLKRRKVPMGLLNTMAAKPPTPSSESITTKAAAGADEKDPLHRSVLDDVDEGPKGRILDIEPYEATFGPGSRRKRP